MYPKKKPKAKDNIVEGKRRRYNEALGSLSRMESIDSILSYRGSPDMTGR